MALSLRGDHGGRGRQEDVRADPADDQGQCQDRESDRDRRPRDRGTESLAGARRRADARTGGRHDVRRRVGDDTGRRDRCRHPMRGLRLGLATDGVVAGRSVEMRPTRAAPAAPAAAAPAPAAPAAATPIGGVATGSASDGSAGVEASSPRGFRPPLPRGDRDGVTAAVAAAARRPRRRQRSRSVLSTADRRASNRSRRPPPSRTRRHVREDRQARRGREGPRRGVTRDDRQPLAVQRRVAGQQPEVDARRRDPRAVRQHDRDRASPRPPDAIGGRRDLVVDVEIEDPDVHHESDLHRAQHALEGDVERIGGRLQLDRLVREAERRDVLLVDQQIGRVDDGLDLVR